MVIIADVIEAGFIDNNNDGVLVQTQLPVITD
jgi:hypothetical protein